MPTCQALPLECSLGDTLPLLAGDSGQAPGELGRGEAPPPPHPGPSQAAGILSAPLSRGPQVGLCGGLVLNALITDLEIELSFLLPGFDCKAASEPQTGVE